MQNWIFYKKSFFKKGTCFEGFKEETYEKKRTQGETSRFQTGLVNQEGFQGLQEEVGRASKFENGTCPFFQESMDAWKWVLFLKEREERRALL